MNNQYFRKKLIGIFWGGGSREGDWERIWNGRKLKGEILRGTPTKSGD
jgi:hypothetical protein